MKSTWVRWLLFIPAAFLAAAVVTTLVEAFDSLFPWSTAWGTGGWLVYVLWVPLGWTLVTLAFILVGARIAPAAQGKVALGLASLAVAVVLLDFLATGAGYKNTYTPRIESNLSDVGMIIGAAVALFAVLRTARKPVSYSTLQTKRLRDPEIP